MKADVAYCIVEKFQKSIYQQVLMKSIYQQVLMKSIYQQVLMKSIYQQVLMNDKRSQSLYGRLTFCIMKVTF